MTSKLPKAELHVHLEGTIRPELAIQLANRNKLPFPTKLLNAQKNGYQSKDFISFLNAYDQIAFLIKHPKDYYDLTYDYLKESANEGCIYTEMMYSPDHAEKSTGIPSHEHLAAIEQAIFDAEHDFGIIGRTIITGVRHFGQAACERVAQKAVQEPFSTIVGFGLGGNEIDFPVELFSKTFRIAHDGGLGCTIHAGEFGTAKSIQHAIHNCYVRRIGHGIAAAKSPETLAIIKKNNVHLEVCPSSNLMLGLCPDIASHPIDFFIQQGISVSINSDDPPFMETTIGREYQKIQETFQYSNQDLLQFTKNAIQHAFIDNDLKQTLLNRLGNPLTPFQ
jgi:adenosine deaminase